jgi:GTPase SAR1 family protein
MKIKEHKSKLPNIMPVKEKMSVFIPDIDKNIPNRNGAIIAMLGSGGSGKTSLLLSLFKSKNYYRNKFDNLYVFTPLSSFLICKKPSI